MVTHSENLLRDLEKHILVSGKGLEIAPYFDPCLHRSKYDVMYTDYIDNEEIQRKVRDNPDGSVSAPLIDFVWVPGERLRECAPEGNYFDYVLASHVMEHVPNPIGWLNELLSVVKDGGKIAIFLPSKKFNFDCFRQETQYYQLVQWWIEQPAIPTVGQLLDFMSNVAAVYHDTVFDEDGVAKDSGVFYKDADAITTAIHVYNNNNYMDVHCTVWSSDSFREIFSKVIKNGLMNVSIDLISSDKSEFMVILTKNGEPALLPPEKN